jgi:hypothetical protein
MSMKVLSLLLLVTCARAQTVVFDDEPVSYENITRIEEILTVFNLDLVASQWSNVHHRLGARCSVEVADYLRGLRNRKIWAMKSECDT